MKTPTLPTVSLPHVSLPSVSLPHVDVPDVSALADRAGDVGELVSDAWSTGVDRAQDLASAAFEVIEDIPDKAIALAGAVIPALRPTPRRSRRPWLLLVAVLASVAVVAWIVKRRRASTAEPYPVPGADVPATGVSAAS